MAVTMVLSRSLQKVNQDLYQSMQSVNYVASTLQKWRDDSQSIATGDADDAVDEWCSGPHGAFFVAKQVGDEIGVDLIIPRCASRQTARNNVPSDSPSTYYGLVSLSGCYPYVTQGEVFAASTYTVASCSSCSIYDWHIRVDRCR